MVLKPQDLVVALQLALPDFPDQWTYPELVERLRLSVSEANAATHRASNARLLTRARDRGAKPSPIRVELATELLGPLMDELCLVGGCVTGLLLTDPGSAPIRPTVDVDVVLDVVQYGKYGDFENRLRARGSTQGGEEDDPICRWRRDSLILDVMPVGGFLGFSNQWYAGAIESRVTFRLPSGRPVFHADAPHFLGTKLAAFESRGEGDAARSQYAPPW